MEDTTAQLTHFKMTVPDTYRWVMLVAGLLCVHCFLVSFKAGSKRKAYFKK